MNILIRDTYIWVGFQSQCLFSLIPFFSLKERQIHFSRIHFRPSQPSENQGENCLRSEDDLIPRQLDWAQLRRDWLVIKRAPFWILSLLECDAHLHKFIILYWFFWMFFRKGVVRGVSLMTTRTVLVLATVVSIRDKFFYPCCARCHKKVYFRDAEATMWVRLFDCFEMQQHYTRSLNVKFLCCCWLFEEQQALQSY